MISASGICCFNTGKRATNAAASFFAGNMMETFDPLFRIGMLCLDHLVGQALNDLASKATMSSINFLSCPASRNFHLIVLRNLAFL